MIREENLIGFLFFLTILFQSCTMVKITVSDQRSQSPRHVLLDGDTVVTTWGAIKVNQSDFFPSSFRIKSNGKVIFIDPVETNGTDKADYLFLTHAHPDHFSMKDIRKLTKPETIFICARGPARRLSKYDYHIKQVKPGDKLDLGDGLKCEAVAAYNTKPVFLWIKAHPKSQQNVGYILTLGNRVRIYHAGDTDYIPEMSNIRDISLALVPVGGDNLTMNIEDAAKMVNEIGPEVVVPMHYEVKKQEDLMNFKSLVEKKVKVEIL